jgi:2-polyprenyl-3-methyl-5-hydroxy-6-metoxy-1,4-benzoquinol methylase
MREAASARSGESTPACLICRDRDPERLYRITRFSVLRCRACRQIFLWPILSDREVQQLFRELYTTGEGSVPELRDYYGYCYEDAPENPLVQLYERWLDRLEQLRAPGRLLDVGCGTGLFLAVARRRGWEPFGVDECREAIAHAREHFELPVWEGAFSDLGLEGKAFDAITMWDIVEHARDPVALLRTVRGRLAPGGVVGLSTPNQRSILDVVAGALYRLTAGRLTAPLEKFYIEQHFLYFTPETLEAALARAGLRLVRLERELTDLRRLALSPPKRWLLEALFFTARRTGLENRLFALAEIG